MSLIWVMFILGDVLADFRGRIVLGSARQYFSARGLFSIT
jgi:hypothetical protein